MLDNIYDYSFITKICSKLTEAEIEQCAELFSEHYGCWGKSDPKGRNGQRVKLGKNYYHEFASNKDYYVALAYHNDNLIGQAFYIKRNFYEKGYMSWVLQIVVHSAYRNKKVGKTLLYSIWGFSGDSAWGLATTNPLTVKTLESATFRKVDPKVIFSKQAELNEIGSYIRFVNQFDLSETHSLVNTEFFIDLSDIDDRIKQYENNWELGDIKPGYEWLAFTFLDQDVDISEEEFNRLVEYSETMLKAAYERMEVSQQPWSQYEKSEIDYVIDFLKLDLSSKIADFGCGIGRHSLELAKKGYEVIGIDFIHSNIERAQENARSQGLDNVLFMEDDCRTTTLNKNVDLVLCLYDVVGSFPDEEENKRILNNIYKNLKPGGYAVISVMNMELTDHIAKYKIDILKEPKRLINLRPSNTMQSSGNVFNPDFFIIDNKTRLVYRKEQFQNDGKLSAEYVIRDKRYTMNEISTYLKEIGFEVVHGRFVQAGRWNTPLANTDFKAKEILVFCRK